MPSLGLGLVLLMLLVSVLLFTVLSGWLFLLWPSLWPMHEHYQKPQQSQPQMDKRFHVRLSLQNKGQGIRHILTAQPSITRNG